MYKNRSLTERTFYAVGLLIGVAIKCSIICGIIGTTVYIVVKGMVNV